MVQVDAVLARLPQDVRLARELGDEHATAVSHRFGIDVLVRLRVLLDRGDVHPALVREGRVAYVWLRRPRLAVGELGREARDVAELAKIRFGDAVEAHLQDQARDDGDEVRIAAALAEAVESPLHLPDSLADRGKRAR